MKTINYRCIAGVFIYETREYRSADAMTMISQILEYLK
jgi:hypothetical protein